MQSARVDVFFSCSFRDEDRDVNDLFLGICSALDIKCINVDGAYSEVPPDIARKKIDQVQGLIAIATKRNKLESGDYAMPSAVQEELAMAYGKEVPILFFVENGVSIEGMKGNFGTFQSFNREDICKKDFLEKAIRSIHTLKLGIISPNDLIYDHDTPEVLADYVNQLVELKRDMDGYRWAYYTSKRLQFLNVFKSHIPVTFWATVPAAIPEGEPPIHAEIALENHSRNLSLKIETIKEAPDCSKSLLKIDPHPDKGDFIEYSTYVESKFFNPIYFEDIAENMAIEVGGKSYACMDGFIPIQRTKKSVIEFRFPRGYPLSKDCLTFFVGSYTDEVDYLVESEMSRANVKIGEIGGNLTIRIEIESPLLRHMYGIAWNPPRKI